VGEEVGGGESRREVKERGRYEVGRDKESERGRRGEKGGE